MGKGKYKGRRAEAFIFDLDGTLIDSGLDIALSANFARAHFGMPELEIATAISYVGDGVVHLLQRTLGHDLISGQTGLPVGEEQLEEGLAVFVDHYGRHLLDHTRLYPGVLETLMRFRRFPVFLATNKPRKFTDQILSGLHLDGAFKAIVAGDEASAKKPDPAHLELCLRGTSLDPAQVAVVGDSPNDIHAAQALGAISVGCTYGLVEKGLVKSAQPDHLLEKFADLADLFPSRSSS